MNVNLDIQLIIWIILTYFSLKQDFRNFEEHNIIKIRLIINEWYYCKRDNSHRNKWDGEEDY